MARTVSDCFSAGVIPALVADDGLRRPRSGGAGAEQLADHGGHPLVQRGFVGQDLVDQTDAQRPLGVEALAGREEGAGLALPDARRSRTG